jgi:hypothetical protein
LAKRYITTVEARVYEKHGRKIEYLTKNPYEKKAPSAALCKETPTKPKPKPKSKSKKVSKKFINELVKLLEAELNK